MRREFFFLFSVLLAYFLGLTKAKSSIFIFGDSYLDAGNNDYINTTTSSQANFWPYGITFFHYPTGRFSDGRIIADFIAEYANLPLIPPFLQPGQTEYYDGSNFASGGAGALVQTFQGQVIDLHMQLSKYKKVEEWFINKLGNVEARKRFTRAIYTFSVGTNDYLTLFFNNSTLVTTYSKSQYVDMVVGNITYVINEIYKTGGRKFAFLNVPSIGCIPVLRILTPNGDCLKEASSYTMLHNEALFKALKELEKKLPGFKYSLYDFYTNLQLRIDQPSKYGYVEGKTACCGTGKFNGEFSCGGTRPVKEFELCKDVKDYVFWDSIHPTEEIYSQFAADMWNNTSSYGSYSIKDLFHLP